MNRRSFVGGAFAGMPITGAFAAPQKTKAGDIPTTIFGKTGTKVSVIAQGGARMDLHPDVQSAALRRQMRSDVETWFSRKALRVCDGGFRRRTMYLPQ